MRCACYSGGEEYDDKDRFNNASPEKKQWFCSLRCEQNEDIVEDTEFAREAIIRAN